ncbi:lachesin [Trichonephila clavipes]|nr:lachesin [Trichonephila clavipes]
MLGSRTDLHIFDAGSVNGTRYCNEILLPYVRLFRGAMESENIERLDWPARSPDLNPIEHVWDFLGRRLAARTLPPVTIRELRLALQDEWAAMPQQLIDTLILSMGRRCETCLAVREIISPTKDRMFLAGHPSQGCFGLQSHCAPCYFFNQASFYPSDFSFNPNAVTYEGEILSITRVSRLHTGAYLCIAANGVPPSVSRRIILHVHFPPVLWIPNQLVGAVAGRDVTLDCHTEAYPTSINYWGRRVNEMIITNDKMQVVTKERTYKSHIRLTIKNLQSADFGVYKCFSKNSLGAAEGSVRLYEIQPPTSQPTKDTSSIRRQSSEGFEPRTNGTAVSVANHYIGWATLCS